MAQAFIIYAAPHYFWLLPLIIAGLSGIAWYGMTLYRSLRLLTAPEHRSLMLPHFSWMKTVLRLLLMASALCALWLALLRPQYRLAEPEKRYEYGRDLVIAIDISRSMLVEDCKGLSRLACAKKKILDIVSSLPSERLGLIVFSGSALVQCPLTKDGVAFRMFLDMLDTDILAGSTTTSLAAALHTACTLFTQTSTRTNKLVVLVTDGEDFSADFAEAERDATEKGLQVSILGVGSVEGGPIPLYDTETGERTGYQRDEQGAIAISRLNEQLIKSLVNSCNGLYAPLDPEGARDITQLASWVNKRELEQGVSAIEEQRGELYMVCSGWALCALALAWML